jgi:hypothetical protein
MSPIALFDYLLLDIVKWAWESIITSSTQVDIKSPDSPLYTRRGGIHFSIALMQARIEMNLWLPSYFDLVIHLDSNVALDIILFSDRPNPIKNPFSSKLYIFLAIILYFSMTIAS